MRLIFPAILLCGTILSCSSATTFEMAPKTSRGHVEAVLIELYVDHFFSDDERYLAIYTPMERTGELFIHRSGHTGRRGLTLQQVQALMNLAQQQLLSATTPVSTCSDCSELRFTVRIGHEVNGFTEYQSSEFPKMSREFLDIVAPGVAPD